MTSPAMAQACSGNDAHMDDLNDRFAALRASRHAPEAEIVARALSLARAGDDERAEAREIARKLCSHVREQADEASLIDRFMQTYRLSDAEGVMLMCLAEALLRVPDARTADALIADKIGSGAWTDYTARAEGFLMNASAWGLVLTGRVIGKRELAAAGKPEAVLGGLIRRTGQPVIREAVRAAMQILGQQFVTGETIDEAMKRARPLTRNGDSFSFDMLGEAARTEKDAQRYLQAYSDAISALAGEAQGRGPEAEHGISIKLSALHPRYEFARPDILRGVLYDRVIRLTQEARAAGIGLTIDAEEADRLEPSLAIIARLAAEPSLKGWDGLGLAVQAYQKRAMDVINWIIDTGAANRRRMMVRLVKGAYWDTEIKHAQTLGLADYPVFTRKENTDISYLACAARMLDAGAALYPAFATHNAVTIGTIAARAGGKTGARPDYEFQRLHGMGEALYTGLREKAGIDVPVRIYAPVGEHRDLLAYLVRRMLENGANTSFVNQIASDNIPLEQLLADPRETPFTGQEAHNPRIPLPAQIFGPERRNASGIDLTDTGDIARIEAGRAAAARQNWKAGPLIGGRTVTDGVARLVQNPADGSDIGACTEAGARDIEDALARSVTAFPAWNAKGGPARAAFLEKAADLMEEERARFHYLLCAEGGKCWPDIEAEIREAVDFLRYYASRARAQFAGPVTLPGPTGEKNTLALEGRGTFACIAPWNFPLAIFIGQVAAALAAGNCAIAKPAEQTPLVGHAAIELLLRAGVPGDVVQMLPGDGKVGAALVADPRIAGVAFTGSTATARAINRMLADRDGPIIPLIAETGGLNAMIADATALPEQVTRDVIDGAFRSAGQRCSALRVLYLQDDVADAMMAMIAGAMQCLDIGDPARLSTDIGPVIDADAASMLEAHIGRMKADARLIARAESFTGSDHGHFIMPHAFEISDIDQIGGEKFGPVLHVIRWKADRLDDVVNQINATGFGLTFGVHSRIDGFADALATRINAGNIYINRNQIGAVVGSQPFGGRGLSGTGPKAGGPHYLQRFATERAICRDTTATGGNASLLLEI